MFSYVVLLITKKKIPIDDRIIVTNSLRCFALLHLYHRDILAEATPSQKECSTSVSSGDQGGEPTLIQCY